VSDRQVPQAASGAGRDPYSAPITLIDIGPTLMYEVLGAAAQVHARRVTSRA
jgi:hypothetical protein